MEKSITWKEKRFKLLGWIWAKKKLEMLQKDLD
jgi:hypothetical protein